MGGGPKAAYATPEEAEQARAGDPDSNIYECPHGHGWHVGHRRGYRYGMNAGRKFQGTRGTHR